MKAALRPFIFFLLLSFLLRYNAVTAQNIIRGPYIQMVNQTATTIRWRTDVATDSKINYGVLAGNLTSSVSDASLTTEHELRITNLNIDTKYYYSIGSQNQVLDAAANNWFVTAPATNTTKKIRIAAFGDCGNGSVNQINVRNAYLKYLGNNNPDLWLLLGDNAYNSGYDNEFQTKFFDVYKNTLLRNHPLFPTPGNHDYRNSQTYAADRTIDYYKNFTLPSNAECGGVASGTEAYYSFDWGPIHFLSLDSYGKEDNNTTRLYDTLGAQVQWIKADLATNNKKWVIAYWHHPPFTMGSHNSDNEAELVNIRQNFIRILERYGVDLVLCGHSHNYERSYLLKGYYTNEASFSKSVHTADSSSAKYDGMLNSCPYHYNSGHYQHGTVYVVSGSAGQGGGTQASYPHDALPFTYTNGTNGGSLYIEVEDNRLDAKMIGYDSTIKDQFTIIKDVNKYNEINIYNGEKYILNASWPGNYAWNTGATNRAITTQPLASQGYFVIDNNNCLKDSFYIHVTPLPQVFTFNGNGNWSNASNWVNNLIPPADFNSNYEIVIDPVIGGECILDITQNIYAATTFTLKKGKKFRVKNVLNFLK